MRRAILFLAGIPVCALVIWAQTAPTPSPEDQVRQVVRDWLVADSKGDRAALNRIIADDFMGAAYSGDVLYKDDIVPPGDIGPRIAPSTLKEATVRIYGDTAVAIGRAEVKEAEHTGEFRFFIVEQKRGDTWKMIACNLTRSSP